MKRRIGMRIFALTLMFFMIAGVLPANLQETAAASAQETQQDFSTLKPSVKAASSGASIKLSWEKAEQAAGYQVYCSASPNADFKLAAKTKETSYQHKKRQLGKTYYYKVRAFQLISGAVKYTQYSDTVKIMARPAAPTLKLKGSVGKVTVSWTKVKGASGYQIASASSANGKFRKLATVSSKKSRRYVHKKRKGGKTYYYKVRSYTKVGKRKVYSKFSPVKKATPPTKLQSQTNQFIKKATKPSMTKEQKLRACYVYMRDHYTYKTREVVEIGATGWVSRYASKFFSDKGGNCCSWTAAYTTVAKRLGFQAKAISGKIYYTNGKLWGRHGWTEIPMEGKIRVFDPEIEYSYRRRGKKINLYKVSRTDNGVAIYKRK